MAEHVMWALISKELVNAVGEDACEAQIGDAPANVVTIDKLSVPENGRANTEVFFNFLLVFYHLDFEFIPGHHTCQGVMISFSKKFNTACSRKTPEAVEYFRRVFFELIDGDAGDGERYPDVRIFTDQLQQQGVCRQIAIAGNALHDLFIKRVIKVRPVRPDIKKS
jgi:hypothetical protein